MNPDPIKLSHRRGGKDERRKRREKSKSLSLSKKKKVFQLFRETEVPIFFSCDRHPEPPSTGRREERRNTQFDLEVGRSNRCCAHIRLHCKVKQVKSVVRSEQLPDGIFLGPIDVCVYYKLYVANLTFFLGAHWFLSNVHIF